MMKHLLTLLLAALLSGCASYVSIQSSWYVLNEGGESRMYVAILNQGNTDIKLTELVLNPIRDSHWILNDPQHSGFVLGVDDVLQPGQVLVKPAKEFNRLVNGIEDWWGDCRVPIEIDIRLASRKYLFINTMRPGMPGALPVDWEVRCAAPSSSAGVPDRRSSPATGS